MRAIRVVFQLFFVVSALYLGVGLAHGWTTSSVERYCPLGGLATSYSLFTDQRLSCATSVFNVTLLLALLLLTIIARKAFCSWICPIGTLSEWLGSAGQRISKVTRRSARRRSVENGDTPRRTGRRNRPPKLGLYAPPRAVDAPLRWLRLPILALVLGFSFALAELVFRPFCPYYVSFSMHGHEVAPWSYAILGGLVVLTVAIPMAWCRYLCPLGGALWPFSKLGGLRLRRDLSTCTSCRACDRACPHSIPISTVEEVSSGECTLCLECTRACRVEAQPLSLHGSRRARRPLPQVIVPILVVAAILTGVLGGDLIAIPSYSQTFDTAGELAPEERQSTTLEVSGVRCVDTARRASNQLDGLSGVLELTAYASDRELVVVYDPHMTDLEQIVRAIEAPVYDEERREFFFHVFKVVAIDGRTVE